MLMSISAIDTKERMIKLTDILASIIAAAIIGGFAAIINKTKKK